MTIESMINSDRLRSVWQKGDFADWQENYKNVEKCIFVVFCQVLSRNRCFRAGVDYRYTQSVSLKIFLCGLSRRDLS